MRRTIVRAAMNMEEVEQVAEYATVEDEEYGEFIYLYQNEESGFIAELNDSDGSIHEFSTIDECVQFLTELKIEQYSCDGGEYTQAEIDRVIQKLEGWFE